MTISPHALSTAIAIGLIVLLYYRRFRRSFGRQAVRPGRMVTRIVVLVFAAAAVIASGMLTARTGSMALVATAGGLVAGAVLGFWGVRLTRFERQPDGVHYIPHSWFGIAIMALLVARLAYRFVALGGLAPASPQSAAAMSSYQHSPLTLALFGLLVGYYVVYYLGVLYMSNRLPPSAAASPDKDAGQVS